MPDEASSRIPLYAKNGAIVAYTLVGSDDAAWLSQWTWRLLTPPDDRSHYAIRSERIDGHRVRVYMHREILGLPRKKRRQDPQGDHINRDGLDNRRANLRVATHAQNLQNKASYRGSSSRYRGVSWNKVAQKWHAYMRLSGKLRYLGLFDREEDAAKAAAEARQQHMPFSMS